MIIPENKIEEIRSTANIVDIIAERVQLRKRGKNYLGLCPFHTEKTPSFTVSEEKQIYHCFGCHAGGNVFKFLMEYEKISFVEAVQQLANQLGITLEFEEQTGIEKQSEQEILYEINTQVARYFSDNLLNSLDGEIARDYFNSRKIKTQTMRSFGLGYAIPSRDHLVNFLRDKKIDLDKALQLGLIGMSNDNRLYDKFSGRIIFPIFSPNGRVVAFAGRILDDKEGYAKYLNSPESIIYSKGRILYGLSHAKDEIRRLDKAILVEGYMDLISLFQNGIKNVVAVSGTALTEEQVQLLSRYTKNVVLLFDADTAGIKASMRSIELLLRRDIEIKIVSLPSGEDPDSFVNNFGREKFEELIKQAQNFLEFQTAYFESQGMFEDPAKAAEAIRELVKPAALISDEIKRNLLIKAIAKRFNLREKLLETELDKIISKTEKQVKSDLSLNEMKLSAYSREQIVPDDSIKRTTNPLLYNLEKELIKLLFEGDESVVELISHHITHDEFIIDVHSELAQLVYESHKDEKEIVAGSLLERIEDEKLRSYVLEITFERYSIPKRLDDKTAEEKRKILYQYALDTVKNFKLVKLDLEIADNHKKIEGAESEEERSELMKLNRDLSNEKKMITEELSKDLV